MQYKCTTTFIGGKKLCLLCIFGVFGISLYLLLFSTDILRGLWIIRGECEDNNTYAVLENAIYSCITLLQGSELLIFIGYAGYYLKWSKIITSFRCHFSPKKLYKWFLTKKHLPFLGSYCVEILFVAVFLLMMWLAVKILSSGYIRDKKYYAIVNFCRPNHTSKYEKLAVGHAILIGITLFLPNTVHIIVIVMFGFSRKYWKDSLKALRAKTFGPITDNEHIDLELEKRCVILSRIYAHTGEKVRVICNALEAWFMVQYLVYLLLLTTDLIHIIRPLYYERPRKNIFDLIYTTLNIVFGFFAFFLPYLMAVLCNKAHSDYYNALLKIFQTANVQEKKSEEQNSHHLGRGANGYENLEKSVELADPFDNVCVPMSPEDRYHARSLWKKIEKRDQFDFCPSFLGITIPINSPGYTFSVVLAFMATLFNFTVLE